MFNVGKDADFAQQIMRMRQEEQDVTEPDEESKVDAELAAARKDDEAPQVNFMTRLYEDETFVKEKELIEEQIIQATEVTQESKGFIAEMDNFLKDLESWKQKRPA